MWHRLQILVTRAQKQWLDKESYTTGKSIAEIVRDAIEYYRKSKNK